MPIAAVLHGAGDLRLESRDEAPLAPGFVRVRFGGGGICGSDLHYFLHGRTGNFTLAEPLVLGHEIAGEVILVGDGVAAVAAGDRVAVNPARPCGKCARCREGRPNLCSDIFFMGSASRYPHMQGGFAETIDVRADQCVALPPHVSFPHAALAEPLAVCLHAAARAGEIAGRSVLVTGAGPIGLLLLAVSKHSGAHHVAAIDLAPAALERARALGADDVFPASAEGVDGEYDIVFEASGSPHALAAGIRAARRGGVVVQVGNLPGEPIAVPANAIMAKELDVKGSFRFADEFAQAVALISAGTINLDRLITASFPLSRAPEAFEIAADRTRSAKVVLTPAE